MGVILGAGVVPIALCVTWKKANKWGCMAGAVAGFFLAIMTWLITTATLNDNVINVTVSFSHPFILLSACTHIKSQTSGGKYVLISFVIFNKHI